MSILTYIINPLSFSTTGSNNNDKQHEQKYQTKIPVQICTIHSYSAFYTLEECSPALSICTG